MNTQHKYINVIPLLGSIILLFMLICIVSCDEDDDFRIIPEGVSPQTITSITPSLGDVGTSILVTGTNFSSVRANNKVSFNGIPAEVIIATATELTVIVPEGTTTGAISISIGQNTVEGPVFSVVAAPQITELSTTGAAVGETITITGVNFGDNTSEITVSFNGAEAEITAASQTEITVVVPENATTGPLTVEVFELMDTIDVFSIAPTIISFEPESGIANQEITITGTNFSINPNSNNVSINGVLATVISATPTRLVVEVPIEATSGKIALEVEELLAVSDTNFITVPTIDTFTPELGGPDTEVIITGGNFSINPTENIVSFNGVAAEVLASSPTSITALVPGGTDTGPITVTVNEQIATSAIDFMVDNSIQSLTVSINDINDDVEEAADGRMSLDSSDLELGEFDTASTPDLGLQKIGLRFNNITIPAGVTIQEAVIVFVPDQTSGADPTEMTIFGENIGNSAPYAEDDGNLSARALTTSSAVWNIPEWTGDAAPTPLESRTTVDISSIITEIISRGDWAEGNSMNFIFEATGVSAGATENNVGREAETYDVDNPQEGAQLIIVYK